MKDDAQSRRKARELRERRGRYFEFLDRRIPELHAEGYNNGVLARKQADSEYRARR